MAALALPAFHAVATLTENEFEPQQGPTGASLAAFTRPKEQMFVAPSKGGTWKIIVTTRQLQAPAWVAPIVSGLISAQSLPDNWDSYGARKVQPDVIGQSLSILEQIMEVDSPPPSIVPLGSGGIQLEWHRNQQDLEIEIPVDDVPHFFYQDRRSGIEHEGFAREVAKLAPLLRGLV